jgi:steroid delta-isomerase-like uncharacterized protein
MSTATNIACARRFLLEHNQEAYMRSLDELLAPDCLVHEYLPGLPNPMNREGYNQFLAAFRNALPDIRNSIEDVIADGDKVVVRWSGSGTHTGGDLMGIPANDRPVVAHGVYVLRFADGKIAEVWNNWDNLNVVQQLEMRA